MPARESLTPVQNLSLSRMQQARRALLPAAADETLVSAAAGCSAGFYFPAFGRKLAYCIRDSCLSAFGADCVAVSYAAACVARGQRSCTGVHPKTSLVSKMR